MNKTSTDIEPFIVKPMFPYQRMITSPLIIICLIGAHLWSISYLWCVLIFGAEIIPSELMKIKSHGISKYLSALNIRCPTARDLGVSTIGTVSVLLLAFIVAQLSRLLFGVSDSSGGGHLLSTVEINPAIGIGLILFMYLVVGPLEEYFFREKLQSYLKSLSSKYKGVLYTNILFALPHILVLDLTADLTYIVMGLTLIFCIGCVMSILYEYTDNLIVPSLSHSTYNSILIVILIFA